MICLAFEKHTQIVKLFGNISTGYFTSLVRQIDDYLIAVDKL